MREDNTILGKTYVYEYDQAGNITKKYTYALTAANTTPQNPEETYIYGYGDADWGDKLTSYRGESITYDEVGNPLSYYNGKRYTFTWENGRRLETATVDGVTLTFTYNAEGIRTSKTVGGTEHTYHLNGSQIITETRGRGQSVIIYLYDAEGSPIGMKYRGGNMDVGEFEEYWFEKNLQGDIVAVYNAAGTKLISYTYDAWGNFTTTYHNGCTASHHANLNPFHYRGYYYDVETGLYYLQSRYYDPVIGRFVNADGMVSTGQGILGNNMYAYCNNNPQTYCDPCGTCIHFWFLLGLLDCDKCKSGPAFIDDFKNADGSYSVYDNKRDDPDRVFHEQVLAVNASGASLSPKDGELTLGALDVTVMTGGWEFEHFDLSLLDLGKAEASAGLTDSQFSLSAMASIWAPSVTWTIWGVDISLSAHVGSVGAALELGSEGVEIGAASGWGIGLSISWD